MKWLQGKPVEGAPCWSHMEAADYCGLSVRRFRAMLKDHPLPERVILKRIVWYHKSDVEKWKYENVQSVA